MGSGADDVKTPGVARQNHYVKSGQPILMMHAMMMPDEFDGYLKGNIIKYVARYRLKNGLEDLQKAQVYLNWLIEHVDTGKITV